MPFSGNPTGQSDGDEANREDEACREMDEINKSAGVERLSAGKLVLFSCVVFAFTFSLAECGVTNKDKIKCDACELLHNLNRNDKARYNSKGVLIGLFFANSKGG